MVVPPRACRPCPEVLAASTSEVMNRMIDGQPRTFLTAILRPPVKSPGKLRRWSAHCLDVDIGVSAQSAATVRMRLASSIAAHIAVDYKFLRRCAPAEKAYWDVAREAPLVKRQLVETEAGPIEVRYVLPAEEIVEGVSARH